MWSRWMRENISKSNFSQISHWESAWESGTQVLLSFLQEAIPTRQLFNVASVISSWLQMAARLQKVSLYHGWKWSLSCTNNAFRKFWPAHQRIRWHRNGHVKIKWFFRHFELSRFRTIMKKTNGGGLGCQGRFIMKYWTHFFKALTKSFRY